MISVRGNHDRWVSGPDRGRLGASDWYAFSQLNDRRLVVRHDRATREVEFNARLHAFARHWQFRPRACAPYRARTKDKDERGVGYVKKNAIAGRQFASWSAFEAHLDAWMREIGRHLPYLRCEPTLPSEFVE